MRKLFLTADFKSLHQKRLILVFGFQTEVFKGTGWEELGDLPSTSNDCEPPAPSFALTYIGLAPRVVVGIHRVLTTI